MLDEGKKDIPSALSFAVIVTVLCSGQSRYPRTRSVGKNPADPDPEPPENLSQF